MTAVGVAILAAANVAANGPPLGSDAGGVFPVRSSRVQLESEVVDVWLPPHDLHPFEPGGRVECRYVLRNLRDAPARFEMAFVTESHRAGVEIDLEALRHFPFEVHQGSRPLEVRWVEVDRRRLERIRWVPRWLPSWRMEIPPRGRAELTMRYPINWSSADEKREHRFFRYVARPAALWAGRIRSARIVFHMDSTMTSRLSRSPPSPPFRNLVVAPPNYRWRADGVEWQFHDWEPREHLYFGFDVVEE